MKRYKVQITDSALSDMEEVLIADYNNYGPYISVGDKILVNYKYTVDKVLSFIKQNSPTSKRSEGGGMNFLHF